MKRTVTVLAVVGLIAASLAAGYWSGVSRTARVSQASPESARREPVGAAGPATEAGGGKSRILYYRNPMGLPDTSPVPKKDPMGMDYVPVYEGEEPAGPALKITRDKVQKLGVKTEAAARRNLSRTLRALGTIQVDERAQRTVAPRFEGWIQRLHVNATGQFVRQGQALMDVYSPDLMTAQQEYLVAIRGAAALKDASPEIDANMRNLVEGSIQRLRNWDIAEEELARLRAEGRVRDTITLRSPASGFVLEKPAVQGMRFMPGEVLYKIADLSSLWLLADVFEQDLGLVRPGQAARVRVSAYPDKVFEGKVAFVYPTVTAETRTAKVRIELPNPGNLLKPDMYASVELSAGRDRGQRLSVPDSAVLDSGTRQTVLVRRGEGLFEPREVRLGMRGDGYVEVIDGIKEGEEVVVSANFLIDSESNLKAAVGGFGNSAPGGPPAPVAGGRDAAESATLTDAHAGH
jgi:membrane fusion protein, copper/silver efflux system